MSFSIVKWWHEVDSGIHLLLVGGVCSTYHTSHTSLEALPIVSSLLPTLNSLLVKCIFYQKHLQEVVACSIWPINSSFSCVVIALSSKASLFDCVVTSQNSNVLLFLVTSLLHGLCASSTSNKIILCYWLEQINMCHWEIMALSDVLRTHT